MWAYTGMMPGGNKPVDPVLSRRTARPEVLIVGENCPRPQIRVEQAVEVAAIVRPPRVGDARWMFKSFDGTAPARSVQATLPQTARAR